MEKIWFRLAREFAAAGHEVTHVSRTWPTFPHHETIDGVRMVRLKGYNHTRKLWRNLFLDLLFGIRVARHLPSGDIVACNTVTLPVHLSFFRPKAGKVVAVLGRMPKGHARFYGRVDRLVATSEAVQTKVIQENAKLAPRTLVFPNPIDWKLHQLAKEKYDAQLAAASVFSAVAGNTTPSSPTETRPLTISFVGRMNPEKGIEILLHAAAELARRPGLPAWKLRLVGPQSIAEGGGGEAYVGSLRDLATQAGADVSVEAPIYDAEKLAAVYASTDIFCYPSLAEKGEGLSVAPLEAMAAGAVPVLSSLDCYDDVIRSGENGLLFDHRAPDRAVRLADAFTILLTDSARRLRMSTAAQADSRPFDYSSVAADLLADFATLASPLDPASRSK